MKAIWSTSTSRITSYNVCYTKLLRFRYAQHFKAKRGGHGMGKDRTGAGAEDLVIKVPVGTQIISDEDGETVLADFTEVGQRIVFLEGGLGGRGNASSYNFV